MTFNTAVRIIAPSKEKVREIAGGFKQFNLSQLNGFEVKNISQGKLPLIHFQRACLDEQMIMNTEELATIYHLPNITVSTPNLEWVTSKKLEPPVGLPFEEGITVLGRNNFRGVS